MNPPLHDDDGRLLDIAEHKPAFVPIHRGYRESINIGIIHRIHHLDHLCQRPQTAS